MMKVIFSFIQHNFYESSKFLYLEFELALFFLKSKTLGKIYKVTINIYITKNLSLYFNIIYSPLVK